MGKGKELSRDLKTRIIDLRESGESYGAIAKQLKVPRSSVQTVVQKYEVTGSVENTPRPGRKRKLSRNAERTLVRKMTMDPKLTKKQLCQDLELEGTPVSRAL